MSENKVETATREDADWSFVEDERVMKCIKNAAIKAANEFELVEFEDAQQDALLWLAVRPEVLTQYDLTQKDGRGLLAYRIYSDALREKAVRESDRANMSVYGIFDEGKEVAA